jgi:predicted metal-dependent phosphoesterase TrpH
MRYCRTLGIRKWYNMAVKADLHVHSYYSKDSIITPEELVFYAKKAGLNALAVTDHNNWESARKIAEETDFLIIPGMEVSSLDGHIVALNISEAIPRDLTADETVDRIHRAGGIAIACHPFALLKGSVGRAVTSKFDAIEAINASAFPFWRASRKANEVAVRLHLPKVAGTDAHWGPVIGCAYTVIQSEPTVESIIGAIKQGKCAPAGNSVSPVMRAENQLRFLRKYVGNSGKRAS